MTRISPLLCALTLILAGCASTATSAPRPLPATLRWGVVGAPDLSTLDPALASDPISISVASLVYGGLVKLDGRLHVQPDGAGHWTQSRNGTVYTFHLRPGLRFASGQRVTAADFVTAIARALGPAGASGTASYYLGLVARGGVKALGPTTLRLTLTHPAAHFLPELAFPASYVPDPTTIARYGPTWTDHAAGFGPYMVQSWRHDRSLVLVRNPHFYGGRPSFSRIVLQFFPQRSIAIAAYRAGHLDMISGFEPGGLPAPGVAGRRAVPALAQDYLAFNTARRPFNRLPARRAFAAVWSPQLANRSMKGVAVPARSVLPSAYGIPSSLWRPRRGARAYLHRAQERMSNVSLVLPQDPHLLKLAGTLAHRWHSVLGVAVTVHALNPSNYGAAIDAHNFDLAIVRWGADYPDPQDFLGTQLGVASANITGWTAKPFEDSLLRADSYALSDARRVRIYQEATATAAADMPILPLDEPTQSAVIRPGLSGITLTPLGTIAGSWTHISTRG